MSTSTVTVNPAEIEATDSITLSTVNPSTGRRSKRRIKLVAAALAVLSASTIGLISKADTSEAASGVAACFKTRTGMVVGPVNTHLELYYNNTWNVVATAPTSAFNGCVSFSMTGWYRNYYARIRMYGKARTGDTFWATSPLMALPGNLAPHLGTANVSCVGFCYGV